jgi:hypothetical protein
MIFPARRSEAVEIDEKSKAKGGKRGKPLAPEEQQDEVKHAAGADGEANCMQ